MKAFVKHDLFPYTLCVTVTHMADDGAVETKEMGPSRYYRPESILRMLPDEAGEEVKAKLEEIKRSFEEDVRALRESYDSRIAAVANFVVLPKRVTTR